MKINNYYVKLAPSILSADFSHLGEQIVQVSEGGADYIHIDIMDGHFVPNLTIGPAVVKSIRKYTTVPFDIHLMIHEPTLFIPQFVDAGADILTVHVEACQHLHRAIQTIKNTGIRAGISLNPATPLNFIDDIISQVDLILIMSVNPGFGGQSFIPESLNKIRHLRDMIDRKSLSIEIEVDGGITLKNAAAVADAGCNVLAIGTSIFKTSEGIKHSIQSFRQLLA
jgi:ribulose-phosphate 3-epimerase